LFVKFVQNLAVALIHRQYEPTAHSTRRISKSLFLLVVQATVLATLGSGQPVTPTATRTAGSYDLSSYAYCPYSGGPSIVSIDRMPGNGLLRYRTVETSGDKKQISMIDGYHVMLAYPGRNLFRQHARGTVRRLSIFRR
jgi:hypothetical protein